MQADVELSIYKLDIRTMHSIILNLLDSKEKIVRHPFLVTPQSENLGQAKMICIEKKRKRFKYLKIC